MLKQKFKPVLFLLIAVLAIPALVDSAFAQLQPAISPWLGMADRSRRNSPLGPYLGSVKPQQEMMRAYASQQSQIRSQGQSLRGLQSGVLDLGASVASSAGGVSERSAVPGELNPPREIPHSNRRPAGFNQYLHFYPPHSMPRRQAPYFSPAR